MSPNPIGLHPVADTTGGVSPVGWLQPTTVVIDDIHILGSIKLYRN